MDWEGRRRSPAAEKGGIRNLPMLGGFWGPKKLMVTLRLSPHISSPALQGVEEGPCTPALLGGRRDFGQCGEMVGQLG